MGAEREQQHHILDVRSSLLQQPPSAAATPVVTGARHPLPHLNLCPHWALASSVYLTVWVCACVVVWVCGCVGVSVGCERQH
jgi:hypothetical protein